jgi:hypothetical protein
MSDTPQDKQLTTKPAPAAGMPGRRTRPFRDRLLERLPMLPEPAWQAGDAFNVSEEMSGLGDLGADSFLEPLAVLARAKGE